ncbi:MAG: nucleotidyltransferase domain-containing protein [Saprospiraceae bacterium]
MLTTESAIKKVDKFTREIIQTGIPIDRVLLFGSFAMQEQREDSDIDVALFSKKFNGFGFEDKQLFAIINSKKEYIDIDVKTFSSIENNDSPLMEIVKKTGIELFHSV